MNPFGTFWHINPVFRILVFYLAGLLVSDEVCQKLVDEPYVMPDMLWGLGCFLLINLIALMLKRVYKCNLCFGKPYNGFLFATFFFVLGMFLNVRSWYKSTKIWNEQPECYFAVLMENPHRTTKTVRAEALLVSSVDTDRYIYINRRVHLSFLRSDQSESLSVGDKIFFRTVMHFPSVNGNPGSFDYAHYLFRKGIHGDAFLLDHAWRKLTTDDIRYCESLSALDQLRIYFLKYRCALVRQMALDGLTDEGHALFTALALGDKSGLSDEIEQIYTESGTSHILALSGMHLSILMNIFYFLFLRRMQYNRWRWLWAVPVILLIWGYTFIAGLPVSLMRAAWMSSLAVIGLLSNRRNFTLNILFLAAFIMLLFDPFAFYDVGFQLSFTAVWAILLLQKRFMLLFPEWHGWKQNIWQMLTVSFAAQIGTLPLVVYYFHKISLVSSFATLLVSPLTAILLYLFPLYLLFGWWNLFQPVWVSVVTCLASLQNKVLAWLSDLPFSSLEGISLSVFGVIVCYCLLIFLFVRRQSFYPGIRFWGLMICSFLLFCEVIGHYQRKKIIPQLVFYNNPSAPAVHFIDSPYHSYLHFVSTAYSSEESLKKMSYIKRDFWQPQLKHMPTLVTSVYSDSLLYCRNGFLLSDSFSLLVLNDATWKYIPDHCLRGYAVDYIYVCRGYNGDLSTLSSVLNPSIVVLDSSLSDIFRKRYQKQCQDLGWKCYDIYEKGALKVALK